VTFGQLLHSFITDDMTKAVLAAIALDLVLGVAAALKLGSFALGYVANFARNDVLGKVLPFLVIHAAADVAGSTDIVIPGLDMAAIADAMFALVMAAMVGSILSSLKDLGFTALPGALGRG
jgi:hypothetical protein